MSSSDSEPKALRVFQKSRVPRPRSAGPVPLRRLKGPFDLEIGCGSGEYALNRAKSFRRRQIIAIEKTQSRFRQFQKAIQKSGRPDNLWALRANAVWWLAHYGKKNMFENIFFLYPNPYPKQKQANLRWARRPFMLFLLGMLKPGGIVEFRTNMAFYSRELKERMPLFPGISLKEAGQIAPQALGETLFERKYLARGERLHALRFVKSPAS